jgi:deoxyribonuclease V
MDAVSMKPSFSVEKAHETQLRLSKHIISEDKLPKKIRFVAGVDVAYVGGISVGAVAVLDYDSLKLVESQTALCKTSFPYIPTLLSFREVPPTVLGIKKLQAQPDVLLVDGHGFAHPYRCGFASHLGLVVHKPTIGVAKGRLFGEVESAEAEKDIAFLKHGGEVVGAVVTTKYGCEPVYVSVGHLVSLGKAVEIVKHCVHYNRIPEPILKAHEIATEEKRKINMALAAKK